MKAYLKKYTKKFRKRVFSGPEFFLRRSLISVEGEVAEKDNRDHLKYINVIPEESVVGLAGN